MHFNIELHRDTVYFLRRLCDEADRREFYRQLELLRENPIEHSEAFLDPDLSRYMLRFFRFNRNLAVFELDGFRNRLVVRQCRSSLEKPNKKNGGRKPSRGN